MSLFDEIYKLKKTITLENNVSFVSSFYLGNFQEIDIGNIYFYIIPVGDISLSSLTINIFTTDDYPTNTDSYISENLDGNLITKEGWYAFNINNDNIPLHEGQLLFNISANNVDADNHFDLLFYKKSARESYIIEDNDVFEINNIQLISKVIANHNMFSFIDGKIITSPARTENNADPLVFNAHHVNLELQPDNENIEYGQIKYDPSHFTFIVDSSGSIGVLDRQKNRVKYVYDFVTKLFDEYPNDLYIDIYSVGGFILNVADILSQTGEIVPTELSIINAHKYEVWVKTDVPLVVGNTYTQGTKSYEVVRSDLDGFVLLGPVGVRVGSIVDNNNVFNIVELREPLINEGIIRFDFFNLEVENGTFNNQPKQTRYILQDIISEQSIFSSDLADFFYFGSGNKDDLLSFDENGFQNANSFNFSVDSNNDLISYVPKSNRILQKINGINTSTSFLGLEVDTVSIFNISEEVAIIDRHGFQTTKINSVDVDHNIVYIEDNLNIDLATGDYYLIVYRSQDYLTNISNELFVYLMGHNAVALIDVSILTFSGLKIFWKIDVPDSFSVSNWAWYYDNFNINLNFKNSFGQNIEDGGRVDFYVDDSSRIVKDDKIEDVQIMFFAKDGLEEDSIVYVDNLYDYEKDDSISINYRSGIKQFNSILEIDKSNNAILLEVPLLEDVFQGTYANNIRGEAFSSGTGSISHTLREILTKKLDIKQNIISVDTGQVSANDNYNFSNPYFNSLPKDKINYLEYTNEIDYFQYGNFSTVGKEGFASIRILPFTYDIHEDISLRRDAIVNNYFEQVRDIRLNQNNWNSTVKDIDNVIDEGDEEQQEVEQDLDYFILTPVYVFDGKASSYLSTQRIEIEPIIMGEIPNILNAKVYGVTHNVNGYLNILNSDGNVSLEKGVFSTNVVFLVPITISSSCNASESIMSALVVTDADLDQPPYLDRYYERKFFYVKNINQSCLVDYFVADQNRLIFNGQLRVKTYIHAYHEEHDVADYFDGLLDKGAGEFEIKDFSIAVHKNSDEFMLIENWFDSVDSGENDFTKRVEVARASTIEEKLEYELEYMSIINSEEEGKLDIPAFSHKNAWVKANNLSNYDVLIPIKNGKAEFNLEESDVDGLYKIISYYDVGDFRYYNINYVYNKPLLTVNNFANFTELFKNSKDKSTLFDKAISVRSDFNPSEEYRVSIYSMRSNIGLGRFNSDLGPSGNNLILTDVVTDKGVASGFRIKGVPTLKTYRNARPDQTDTFIVKVVDSLNNTYWFRRHFRWRPKDDYGEGFDYLFYANFDALKWNPETQGLPNYFSTSWSNGNLHYIDIDLNSDLNTGPNKKSFVNFPANTFDDSVSYVPELRFNDLVFDIVATTAPRPLKNGFRRVAVRTISRNIGNPYPEGDSDHLVTFLNSYSGSSFELLVEEGEDGAKSIVTQRFSPEDIDQENPIGIPPFLVIKDPLQIEAKFESNNYIVEQQNWDLERDLNIEHSIIAWVSWEGEYLINRVINKEKIPVTFRVGRCLVKNERSIENDEMAVSGGNILYYDYRVDADGCLVIGNSSLITFEEESFLEITRTSIDEDHYHILDIDENGNGFATDIKNYPNFNIDGHQHEVINYEIQEVNGHSHKVATTAKINFSVHQDYQDKIYANAYCVYADSSALPYPFDHPYLSHLPKGHLMFDTIYVGQDEEQDEDDAAFKFELIARSNENEEWSVLFPPPPPRKEEDAVDDMLWEGILSALGDGEEVVSAPRPVVFSIPISLDGLEGPVGNNGLDLAVRFYNEDDGNINFVEEDICVNFNFVSFVMPKEIKEDEESASSNDDFLDTDSFYVFIECFVNYNNNKYYLYGFLEVYVPGYLMVFNTTKIFESSIKDSFGLESALATIESYGGSPLNRGLLVASKNILDLNYSSEMDNYKNNMLMITDGIDTSSSASPEDVLRNLSFIKKLNNVSFVNLGSGDVIANSFYAQYTNRKNGKVYQAFSIPPSMIDDLINKYLIDPSSNISYAVYKKNVSGFDFISALDINALLEDDIPANTNILYRYNLTFQDRTHSGWSVWTDATTDLLPYQDKNIIEIDYEIILIGNENFVTPKIYNGLFIANHQAGISRIFFHPVDLNLNKNDFISEVYFYTDSSQYEYVELNFGIIQNKDADINFYKLPKIKQQKTNEVGYLLSRINEYTHTNNYFDYFAENKGWPQEFEIIVKRKNLSSGNFDKVSTNEYIINNEEGRVTFLRPQNMFVDIVLDIYFNNELSYYIEVVNKYEYSEEIKNISLMYNVGNKKCLLEKSYPKIC